MNFINQSSTQTCRLCLAQTGICFSILENSTIAQMLESLTSIIIEPSDEISTMICFKCRLNLNLAYSIQQKMIKAERRFHEQVDIFENRFIKHEEIFLEDIILEAKIEDDIDVISLSSTDSQDLKEIHITETPIPFAETPIDETYVFIPPPPVEQYPCEFCGRTFSSYQHLGRHKSMHFSPTDVYPCNRCDRVFPTRQLLGRHKYNHNKKKCPICGKEATPSNLKHHLEIHSNDPQICELCGATFKGKNNLRIHMFYSHNSARYKCELCKKAFKKKCDRDLHQVKEHGGEPKFVCDTCGKKFFRVVHLNIHVKRTHLKLKPYVCEFCQRSFTSPKTLRNHRRQHTNETPYKCEFCGEGFKQRVSLRGHLKNKHGVVEKETCHCTMCGKGFASKVALYSHQRIH